MQQRQKCCSHCPGNWTSATRERREDHSCCLPTYVAGNLKLSSLRKLTPGEAERAERLRGKVSSTSNHQVERPTSCYDRFAIAKKFHAENLQHQPLPDRVDDSIFKNVRTTKNLEDPLDVSQKRSSSANIRQEPRRSRFGQKIHAGLRYGPTLGCKTPTTNMDLAICWEAPLDPTYEPSRAIHIDGTDGGPAPAIFALVEHEIPRHETRHSPGKCFKNALESYEAKFSNVRNRCRCGNQNEGADPTISRISKNRFPDNNPSDQNACQKCSGDPEFLEQVADEKSHPASSLDKDLCDELDSIHISNKPDPSSRPAVDSRRGKLQPLHLRNCVAPCECRGERAARKQRQRLIQSAHVGTRNIRRNGLPTRTSVPRPKTPYAKRSFCIDTLTPPFSIVNGCRDADYPEHWRLTSVYQQSYRNPLKQRGTILNYI